MTGSMYASVAGLRAHMQKLTVIGNNVANVNTQGYKKQRTVFRDSVYSMYSGGSNGSETIGGMNPSQLGYGSLIGSIDLNMSSSSYNPGNPMDCALVGDGFFVVGDKEVVKSLDSTEPSSLKSLTLTRVGDFKFGPDNYLVDGKGNVVYGFLATDEVDADGNHIISDQLVPIRLPRWERVPWTPDVEEEEGDGENNTTLDSYKYEIRYPNVRDAAEEGGAGGAGGTGTETPAERELRDTDKPLDATNQINPDTGAPSTNSAEWKELDYAKFSSISIDAGTGCITGICQEGDQEVVIGYLAIGNVTNPNGVSHIGSSYYKCQAGAGDMWISMLGGVNKDLGIEHFNSYQAINAMGGAADGAGGAGGADTNYTYYTPLSAVTGTATEMMTGFLEAPNTDLAEEITELITTQRGYQANTRIITVTDSMLEELVNMKR